jgi:addiction module HigA family antidote
MSEQLLSPLHPGEVLLEEFMKPLGMSANQLAVRMAVPTNRITAILHWQRGITADTALRLGRVFNTSAELWMGLQEDYNLETTRDLLGDKIELEVKPLANVSAQEISPRGPLLG